MKLSNPQRSRLTAKVRKGLSLPWADKWLLMEAFFWLGVMRLALRILPFRRMAHWIGPLHEETRLELEPAALATARRIGIAIRRVSPHTPWTSNCFPQALAAKWMLWQRRIPSTLYLGAHMKDDRSGLAAHAWLRAGPLYVTGGRGHEHYATVGIFGAHPPRDKQ